MAVVFMKQSRGVYASVSTRALATSQYLSMPTVYTNRSIEGLTMEVVATDAVEY